MEDGKAESSTGSEKMIAPKQLPLKNGRTNPIRFFVVAPEVREGENGEPIEDVLRDVLELVVPPPELTSPEAVKANAVKV
jgi:hypothetical protein